MKTLDQVKPIASDLSEPCHTPGPWSNQGIYIMARNPKAPLPNAQTIGRAFPDHSIVGGDTLANAVLMAAAPELLAALDGLLEWGRDNLSPVHNPGAHELLVAAYNAIAKAKGEL
jgi:hypothetical protein